MDGKAIRRRPVTGAARVAAVVIAAAAVALLGPAVPAEAVESAGEPELTAAQLAQAADKRQKLLELRQAGATDAEIERQLGLVKVAGEEPATTGPLSENTAVTVHNPTIYYDRGISAYYASADFRWKRQATLGDGPSSTVTKNVGGRDGFGVRFSRDVLAMGTTASFCPGAWVGGRGPLPSTKPGCTSPQPSEHSADGSVFQYQDKTVPSRCGPNDSDWCAIYLGANGTLVHTFRRLGGGCIQVFTRYAHTWRSTVVSGFDLSHSSLSFKFSSASHRWQAASAKPAGLGC